MIALETEIVASRYDAKERASYFTVERGGRRWTVGIPDSGLAGNRQTRRTQISNAMEAAMRGPADGE